MRKNNETVIVPNSDNVVRKMLRALTIWFALFSFAIIYFGLDTAILGIWWISVMFGAWDIYRKQGIAYAMFKRVVQLVQKRG